MNVDLPKISLNKQAGFAQYSAQNGVNFLKRPVG